MDHLSKTVVANNLSASGLGVFGPLDTIIPGTLTALGTAGEVTIPNDNMYAIIPNTLFYSRLCVHPVVTATAAIALPKCICVLYGKTLKYLFLKQMCTFIRK